MEISAPWDAGTILGVTKSWAAGRRGELGRDQTGTPSTLAVVRAYVRVSPHPIQDSRRAARRSRIVTWVFGIFAVFAISTAVWPQDPGDVAIGSVLGTTSAAVSVAAGVRARRRSRFADEVVKVLGTEATFDPTISGLAVETWGAAQVSGKVRTLQEQSQALAVITPALTRFVPDLPVAAHSAELALMTLCRRVVALEIDTNDAEGSAEESSQARRSALAAASDALDQGVAAYQGLVRAAARASSQLDQFLPQPAIETRSTAERLEFLSVGLSEIARINDRCQT